MPKYFLKLNYGNSPEVEVTKDEFLEAQKEVGLNCTEKMGMTPFGSDQTEFHAASITGRIEYESKTEKVTANSTKNYSPYFDQESPEIPIDGMIASLDRSPSYELDAAAVFKGGRHYLVVMVSGCSCWPDRGSTNQTVCFTRSDVDKALEGWSELLSECQQNNWKISNSQ
jgi:hypothetical protein